MLTVLRLCVALASIHRTCLAENAYNEEEASVLIGSRIADISSISELGSSAEEKLNCFGAFDAEVAEKWTKTLDLERIDLTTRFAEEAEDRPKKPKPPRILAELEQCLRNMTQSLNSTATKTCMGNLIGDEIENDAFISAAELFDNSLELPFLTFLNIHEVRDLLFQNRSISSLTPIEKVIFDRAFGLAMTQENNARDKVFVIDQSCEWTTLKELTEAQTEHELLEIFKLRVLRTLSLRLSRDVLMGRDLKPGRWFFLYNQWLPVRLENMKEMDAVIEDLKGKKFTKRELCRYATTLGSHYAELELATLRSEKPAQLQLMAVDLDGRIQEKISSICQKGGIEACENARRLIDEYSGELECLKSFAEILTNHVLNSISLRFMDYQQRVTYPESICKAATRYSGLVLRYCKCVGSFCSSQDVGELDANAYELEGSKVVKRRSRHG